MVGRLKERYPGLRPVLFYSPYGAAAWAIIGNRIQIVQAARIKARIPGPFATAAPGPVPGSPDAKPSVCARWPARPWKAS